MRRTLKIAPRDVSEPELVGFFLALDADASGAVSLDELVGFLEGRPAARDDAGAPRLRPAPRRARGAGIGAGIGGGGGGAPPPIPVPDHMVPRWPAPVARGAYRPATALVALISFAPRARPRRHRFGGGLVGADAAAAALDARAPAAAPAAPRSFSLPDLPDRPMLRPPQPLPAPLAAGGRPPPAATPFGRDRGDRGGVFWDPTAKVVDAPSWAKGGMGAYGMKRAKGAFQDARGAVGAQNTLRGSVLDRQANAAGLPF